MSQLIAADPDVFPKLAYYYETQCNDLMAIKEFVVANCTLDDAFGVLLSVMKPQYEEARDKTMNGMDSVIATLRDLGVKAIETKDEFEAQENAIIDDVTTLDHEVTQVQMQPTAPPGGGSGYGGGPGGGSGGSGGGSGGGSYTGGSGDVTGTIDPGDDTTSNDGDDDGDTTINVTVNGDNNTVTIGEDGEVDVVENDPETETETETDTETGTDTETPVDGEPETGTETEADTDTDADPEKETDSDTTTGTEAGTGTETGTATETIDPEDENALLDPEVVAAENAAKAELYDKFWQEQSANDPLGRTPEELRLAWESREPIELKIDTTNEVGYAPVGPTPIPEDFSLIPNSAVRPQALIGARA